MSTSGTYTFQPGLGELVLYAYALCGKRPAELTTEHMVSASQSSNMMLARWANQGVNLWAVDLVTVPLVDGQATYDVDGNTVFMLDAYISTVQNGVETDRIIMPVSRTEYASYPNKEQQGATTVFWFDRLIEPTVTLWPVPSSSVSSGTLYLKYYRVRLIQDAEYTSGQQVEIPRLWLEAFADGLAARLARVWAPDRAVGLKAVADESYKIASEANVETAQMYVSPQVGGYYRP